MKISVIMIDGSFRENYHAVDYFCQQTLPINDYELIWVEFYENVNLELQKKIDKYENARIVTLNKKGIYHSSYCFNEGIRQAKYDLIYIPDADVAIEKDFLEKTMEDHQKNENLAMYFFRVEEPKKLHQKNYNLGYLKSACVFSNPSNYGGCLSVQKKWLELINGYEQHPVFGSGFHANGLDIYTRLKNLGLHIRWHPQYFLYHPWHPMNAAGAPVWEVQKVLINYRAKNLTIHAYSGIDPNRNQNFPKELYDNLEEAKRKFKLHKIYDARYNLKMDPENIENYISRISTNKYFSKFSSILKTIKMKYFTI